MGGAHNPTDEAGNMMKITSKGGSDLKWREGEEGEEEEFIGK